MKNRVKAATYEKDRVTLNELCSDLGIKVPRKLRDIADEERKVSFRSKVVQEGDICVIIRPAEEFRARDTRTVHQYELAIERGASLIIMDKDAFRKARLKKGDVPVILVDNMGNRIREFFDKIRFSQDARVVMITGSIGKTTTKDLCHTVVKNRYRTFANSKNTNTPHQIAKHLFYNTNDENELYIQEAGAGYWGSVDFSAEMLKPDIFILTNVLEHHLEAYRNFENIFNEKISADRYMSDDGLIITNYDDENIRNHSFRHRVVSFSVNYENADYRALNIRQDNEKLCFDVYEKKTGESVPVEVGILGEHNAYNAIAAYAFARELGMSPEEITQEFKEYRTSGIRQNLVNIGGVIINLDCYNVAEESIISMLEAGEKFRLKPGAKRIALIGGENKLGSQVQERSERLGEKLSSIQFDKILFCGTDSDDRIELNTLGDAASIMRGFSRNAGTAAAEICTDPETMTNFIRDNVRRNDLLMLKGIYLLDMPMAVDKVFGTSFSFDLSHNKMEMQRQEIDGFETNLIPRFGELEIMKAPVDNGRLAIPDSLGGYQLFRIHQKAFDANEEIESIDFGNSIKNIGKRAFRDCRGIRNLEIPSCVRVLETAAFARCKGLESVKISEGLIHIGEKAFSLCSELKEVHIPESVGYIADDAFRKCGKLIIVCAKDSYAAEFARDNNIEVIEKEGDCK